MTLRGPITQEEYQALSEIIQGEYKALNGSEGKYIPDIEGGDGWAFENVVGLRNSLQAVRNERDEIKSKYKGLETVDFDEYNRLLAKKKEIDEWDPTTDEGFKAKLEESNSNWQKKYDTDLGTANEARDEAQISYKKYLKRASATSAIGKHAPQAVEVLMPHVMGKIDVFKDESGNDHVWVVGEDGKPRITQKAGETGNMVAEELVLSMKENPSFAPNYPGTGATGSGALGTGDSAGGSTGIDPKASPQERLKQARRAGI